MAVQTYDEANGCIFKWKLENISQSWWLRKGQEIQSISFIADALQYTQWSLWLFLKEEEDEKCIGLYLRRQSNCSGPDVIEINFELAFLGNDGSLLEKGNSLKHSFVKGDVWGFPNFEERLRAFLSEREEFLPEDTLTLQCAIWRKNETPIKPKHLYARTVFNTIRRYFVWKIDKISTLTPGLRKKFEDNFIDFDLVLNEGFDKLDIDMISFDDIIKYISCNISIINAEGRKENCGIKKFTFLDGNLKKGVLSPTLLCPRMLMENKGRNLLNDVLDLTFEFVFSTLKYSGSRKNSNFENQPTYVGKEETQNTAVLTDDLKSMYNDGVFSDIEIRTSEKTFPAHKAILSVRSPVFSRMFSCDMREKNSGYVVVTDLEDDTVHRMLLYIYTDSLEDLQLDTASKLYAAADKYEILSLKTRCSSFIKCNLCPTKVCNVLVLADLHQDNDLKSFVENYILEHSKEVLGCQEWKDFMNTHVKLAADVMYRKLFPV